MKYLVESNLYMSVIHDIFKALKIDFNKVIKLSGGENGIAFIFDHKIYKITTDASEVELCYILLNEIPKHYVRIYDIFTYDTKQGSDNINYNSTNKPRYYWVIIEEYLNTKGMNDPHYFDAIDFFEMYIDSEFNYTKSDFEEMIKFYKEDNEFEFDTENNVVFYLKIFMDLFMDLQKYGIKHVTDMKSAHFGIDKDGNFKFFDLRLYKSVRKDIANIKKLN